MRILRLATSPLAISPLAFVLLIILAGCGKETEESIAQESADLIFYGEHIVTMDESNGDVEAVAVKDGRILAVGSREQIELMQDVKTRVINLGGGVMLPGFIDTHGHFASQAMIMDMANVAAPPVGPVNSLAKLQEVLASEISDKNIPEGSWVLGFGYEPSLFTDEVRHPNRDDLDAVSTRHPIYLLHQSGHLGATNSLALARIGYTADTEDPEGGVIVRRPDSTEPSGVLEEKANWQVVYSLPQPPVEALFSSLNKAQDYYAQYGITTTQEGRASDQQVQLLKAYAKAGKLKLDVVVYPDIETGAASLQTESAFRQYQSRLKVGGVKISLDGSIQGFTAWLKDPYYKPPAGLGDDYVGYPAYTQDQVNGFFSKARDNGWQMLVHANADAATQQMLDTLQAVFSNKESIAIGRHTMIHAQMLTENQLDIVADTGVIPSFMAAHPFFYGDYHLSDTIGPERAARIDPLRSAADRGIRFNTHNDTPIFPPDMMRMVWVSVNRLSRSGQVIGPQQRITPMQALKAITIDAAYQYFEENEKGSITPGKLADLVVLETNPLTIDPKALKDIDVISTYKEGEIVFQR